LFPMGRNSQSRLSSPPMLSQYLIYESGRVSIAGTPGREVALVPDEAVFPRVFHRTRWTNAPPWGS